MQGLRRQTSMSTKIYLSTLTQVKFWPRTR